MRDLCQLDICAELLRGPHALEPLLVGAQRQTDGLREDVRRARVGELELAGWELGSGGCARHKLFWVDRLLFTLLGLILLPTVTWRAVRRGCRQRNLYRLEAEAVLAAEVDELRQWMRA